MLLDLKKLVTAHNLSIRGVLHIGAHWGEEDSIYEELSISNRIYFEPLSNNYRVLRNKILNKWECVQLALGNYTGEVDMNVEEANSGQSSSILEPEIHLIQYPHIKFTKKEKVKITKLDCLDFDKSKFNFINIDVQGYELEVFKGASQTLKTIDYIMTEVNRQEVYSGCAKINEIDSFLNQYNFKRVDTSWAGITWGDAFYKKL